MIRHHLNRDLSPRRRPVWSAAILSLAILLTGCSRGTNFSQAEIDKLQPGVTTFEQAVGILGKPNAIRTDQNGRKSVIWAYARTGGSRSAGIVFDKDGVMERVFNRMDSSGTVPGPS